MTQSNPLSHQASYIPQVARRIEDWKSRLIDLSRKNNLLYYRQRKRSGLSVTHPNLETIFDALVVRRRHLKFWQPPDENSSLSENRQIGNVLSRYTEVPQSKKTNRLVSDGLDRVELEKTLKSLLTRSQSDYREKGVRILYAAFGMLVWTEQETSEEVRAPLVLVPVEISRKSFRDPFAISIPPVEEETVLNPALQVRLRNVFKIELPSLPEDWESQSLTEYLNALSQTVGDLGWRVEFSVEIGLFSFHKLVIYNDLAANAEIIKQHNIVRALAGVKKQPLAKIDLPEEKDLDDIEPPEKPFHVLDADSSQRVSIQYASRGQSFVMQGPPGTGKSQTIANIIAECIACGKSVLFVSDKMAALEVVYKRLKEVGLSHFCLELHSSKANKQDVVSELKRCLDEQLVPRKLPSLHDYEKMSGLRKSLNNYVISLHQKHPNLQKSAYDVLGQIARWDGIPFIAVDLPEIGNLNPQDFLELENLASQLKDVWQVVEDADFPWRDYKSSTYELETRSELASTLGGIVTSIRELRNESAQFASQLGLEQPPTLERTKWLIQISQQLNESPKPDTTWLTNSNIDQLIQKAEMYKTSTEWCKKTRGTLLERYEPSVFTLSSDVSSQIQEGLSSTNRLIRHSNISESSILRRRSTFLDFVKRSYGLIQKWIENSYRLSEILDLPLEILTLDRARLFSRIGLLCFSENKPERRWLDPEYLERVKIAVSKSKKAYQEHNLLLSRLEKTYIVNRLLALDLDELIRRYGTSYGNALRWLRPSFHRHQKQLALLTHNGKVPDSVLKDLSDARKLKLLKASIAISTEQDRELLGHFYQGYETNFEGVETAIDTASYITSSYSPAYLSDEAANLFSHGSNPPNRIKEDAQYLGVSIREWESLSNSFAELLPFNRLPTSDLPVNETRLASIREWVNALEKQLTPLCSTTDEVLKLCNNECPETFKQLIADLLEVDAVNKKEADILEKRNLLQTKFGFRYNDLETPWNEILQVLFWTKNFQCIFGSHPVPEALARTVAGGPKDAPSNVDLVGLYNATSNSLDEFESRFEGDLIYQCQKLREMKLTTVTDRLNELRERVDELELWIDFKKLKNLILDKGLSSFLDRLIENRPPASHLVDVLRKGVYQEWITNLYEQNPALGQFRRENHEQLIKEFRKLDQELIHLTPNRVIEAANTRKPQDVLVQASNSEVGVLLREAAKKRRLMPIRELLERIPHILFRIKPCLLMSPMSVSQFLTPTLEQFDLVLFDEASQIVPEDAIGSIYRGKTIVVAGDNKQLPPTSFFQKSMIEDIDWDQITDEDAEVFDSILDECMGIGLPVKTLRWHYRSKHEELIAFSNSRFYDDTLITFPSPVAKRSTLGVKMVYVPDGVYDRGEKRDNPKEAEVVADLVFQHLKENPRKTIGVVTFSIAQMEAVTEAVERRRRENPEFEHFFKEDRLEGFFVKNLENVQGDERDVMMISVGYGYDKQHQITMNFGPVNKNGGERRLNVVVTRAREKTVIVTSIKASDIKTSSANSLGLRALHDYLEYAEKGPRIMRSSLVRATDLESPLEEDVARVVKRSGYNVIPKVGWSGSPIEIGVTDPNDPTNYLLGIEFDGPIYKSIDSARDRDRLRSQVLGQLGWKIHRIWSPTWVSRRESEVRRLTDALDESDKLGLETESDEFSASAHDIKTDLSDRLAVQKVQFAGREKIGMPYKIHPLKASFKSSITVPISGYRWATKANEFHFEENRPLQSRLLSELVNAEGPIHFDYAVKRLADAWGSKRISPRIELTMRRIRDLLIKEGKLVLKGDFLWPPNLKDVSVRIPTKEVPESKRPIGVIPPEEIENALEFIVKYSMGIDSESLMAETAKVFGFNRISEETRETIQEIYKGMLSDRRLSCTNGVVTLPQ